MSNTVRYEYDSAGRLRTAQAGVRTSAVFGTMETVVYTRPARMDFGPVAYEPDLRTFVATHRHLVPDAVLASSLDRRMLPWRGGGRGRPPFGTDKPSGSMFIPPEYRSVNCFVCTASLESASVAVETPSVVAQEKFDILLGAEGTPTGTGCGRCHTHSEAAH